MLLGSRFVKVVEFGMDGDVGLLNVGYALNLKGTCLDSHIYLTCTSFMVR
jgi:hypothetical protein